MSDSTYNYLKKQPKTLDVLSFALTTAIHLLAYYTATAKGYDVDKPRNLTKSVTVE